MSDGRLPVRRRWIGWTVGVLLSLLLIAIGWVCIRGIGAVNDLQQVAKGASQLKSSIAAGDLEGAKPLAKSIAHNAESARSLTSDPVWHAFGALPWIGPNFSAVSEIAEIADDVSADALTPLLDVAADFDLASLGFAGGAIDLAPFAEIAGPLGTADTALSAAQLHARRIDADATLPPLADAIRTMRSSVTEAATVVGSLHGAAVLLPTMLGGEGPRNYVLAMQNNAELRSSGGIIGSIALLHAEGAGSPSRARRRRGTSLRSTPRCPSATRRSRSSRTVPAAICRTSRASPTSARQELPSPPAGRVDSVGPSTASSPWTPSSRSI